jgi:hypothetical protein
MPDKSTAATSNSLIRNPLHEVIDNGICKVKTPDYPADFFVFIERVSTASGHIRDLLLPEFLNLFLHMR